MGSLLQPPVGGPSGLKSFAGLVLLSSGERSKTTGFGLSGKPYTQCHPTGSRDYKELIQHLPEVVELSFFS